MTDRPSELARLRAELAAARAFQVRLAGRVAAASEVLTRLAERKGRKMTTRRDPVPNGSRPVWELVIEDMQARDRLGRERYGTPLQAGNGRDALQDAYEEALDLCVYLRQAIAERDAPADPVPQLLAACVAARDELALIIDDNLDADPPRSTGDAETVLGLLDAAIDAAERPQPPTDPVPAALFEAAVRWLRKTASMNDINRLSVAARVAEWWDDTAERLIRRAVAGGVREECAG